MSELLLYSVGGTKKSPADFLFYPPAAPAFYDCFADGKTVCYHIAFVNRTLRRRFREEKLL